MWGSGRINQESWHKASTTKPKQGLTEIDYKFMWHCTKPPKFAHGSKMWALGKTNQGSQNPRTIKPMQVSHRNWLETHLRLYELNSVRFLPPRRREGLGRFTKNLTNYLPLYQCMCLMANKLIWQSTQPHKTAHGSNYNMLGFGRVNQEISLLHAPQNRRHRCNHLRQARILGLRYHWPPMPEGGLQNCAMRRWSPTISTPRHHHHWSRYVEHGGCGRRSCWGGLAWCVWHPSWAPCSCSKHPSIPAPMSLPAASRTSPWSRSPQLLNINVDDEEISEWAPSAKYWWIMTVIKS